MGVLGLHTIGVALETVLGMKIFEKMFPKRKCFGWRQIFSELIMSGLLIYVIELNFLKSVNLRKKIIFFCLVLTLLGIYRWYIEKHNRLPTKTANIVNNLIFSIQLMSIIGLLTWNGWLSYISTGMILLGNLYLPFGLYRYLQCDFLQAYIFECMYLTIIGLMKNICMVFVGADENLGIGSVNLSGIMHVYTVAYYGILVTIFFYVCIKHLELEKLLKRYLTEYLWKMILGTIGLYFLLSILTDLGLDGYNVKDLRIILLFTVTVIFLLLFALARAVLNLLKGEKKLLDIRNHAIELQYQELQEAYQQNRCLIHDEKHMIQYLIECMQNNAIEMGIEFAEKYGEKLSNNSKHIWTGLPTLDFILDINKRKMDFYLIEFNLSVELEQLPTDDADFIVMLSNLLDNAIDAAKECDLGKRKIELFLQNVNEMFILQITNTSIKEPIRKNNKFVTSKKDAWFRFGKCSTNCEKIWRKYRF